MSLTWPADWADRVTREVRARGHKDVASFVRSHPGEGFGCLARRLGSSAPPSMLSILYYRNARAAGELRAAAIDGLLRLFRDFTPTGWKNYDGGLTPGIREVNMAVS